MKKILTAIIAAAMLASSAGCQVQQPQATHSEPEPAPQALVLNVDSPTDTSEKHIDTSAVIEQIMDGLKVKLNTAEKKKEEAKASLVAEQEKVQRSEEQNEKPDTKPKTATATPTPEPPATEPDAYLKVTVKATPTPPPVATPIPTPVPTPKPPAPTPSPAEPTPGPGRTYSGAGHRGTQLRHRLLDQLCAKLRTRARPAAGKLGGRLLGQPHRGRAAQHLPGAGHQQQNE